MLHKLVQQQTKQRENYQTNEIQTLNANTTKKRSHRKNLDYYTKSST